MDVSILEISKWLINHYTNAIKRKDYEASNAIFTLIVDFGKIYKMENLKDKALKQAGIDISKLPIDKIANSPLGEQVSQVFQDIDVLRGYRPPKRNAEASSILRMLKKGFSSKQIVDCWKYLKNDKFWQDKELFLMSVESQIGALCSQEKRNNHAPALIFGQSVDKAIQIAKGQFKVPDRTKQLFIDELKHRGINWE